MFEEVQLMLGKRNPKMHAAKQVSSRLLLSGIAHCEECGKAMTLRTGKTYRYYYCSSANMGKLVCSGPAIPEKELDDAVLNAVRSRVLSKDHLEGLLGGLQRRERSRAASVSREMPALRSRVSAAEVAMEGLWASLRLAPTLEKDPLFQKNLRLAADELEFTRSKLDDAVEAMDDAGDVSAAAMQLFRDQLLDILDGPNVHRRKIYLESIVQRVEVGQTEVHIEGHIEDLRKAVEASANGSGGSSDPEVRRYVRRWRRERDSNPRYGLP
ncbi:recombinase zinc beta ribbon domain-containing protein [Mesorhizobium sp. CCANP35]|uniref:Recombinase zinc beta ribbon domain-containing protein n=2 Tax=Mesorhizobium neociceri TaxID=1307853 RepID=A0A838B5I6_9HYPH|nr:recombinase zinc beta ribbon domain-containing protein [Mesorhizobium neociceri]